VPKEIVEALGGGKRPPVTVAVMGGVYMIALSADNRAAAGVAGGDEVDVDVALDTAPREVVVPADFDEALNRDPDARRFFDGLSYSNKLRHVLAVEGAKTAETRERRIVAAVETLHKGKVL
jgi:uncharacterized protein YdeI (YjbR/CyaY-like superfamily)